MCVCVCVEREPEKQADREIRIGTVSSLSPVVKRHDTKLYCGYNKILSDINCEVIILL